MMVGKRERDCRNPMRRTTSMTQFAPPDALAAVVEDEEAQLHANSGGGGGQDWLSALGGCGGAGAAAQQDWLAAYRARAAPARAGLHRNSADYSAAETAAFLRACGLCRRRLGPGRDTFMYKGEAAFCSLECRERHITQEEWKDKCAVKPINKDAAAGVAPVTARRAGSGKPDRGARARTDAFVTQAGYTDVLPSYSSSTSRHPSAAATATSSSIDHSSATIYTSRQSSTA